MTLTSVSRHRGPCHRRARERVVLGGSPRHHDPRLFLAAADHASFGPRQGRDLLPRDVPRGGPAGDAQDVALGRQGRGVPGRTGSGGRVHLQVEHVGQRRRSPSPPARAPSGDIWFWKAHRTNPAGYADDKGQASRRRAVPPHGRSSPPATARCISSAGAMPASRRGRRRSSTNTRAPRSTSSRLGSPPAVVRTCAPRACGPKGSGRSSSAGSSTRDTTMTSSSLRAPPISSRSPVTRWPSTPLTRSGRALSIARGCVRSPAPHAGTEERPMNISFSTARRLGMWTLLAIVLVGAVFAVTSLRRVVKEIHHKVELAEVKERQFTQMALRFAMVGADFYRAKQPRTCGRSSIPSCSSSTIFAASSRSSRPCR